MFLALAVSLAVKCHGFPPAIWTRGWPEVGSEYLFENMSEVLSPPIDGSMIC